MAENSTNQENTPSPESAKGSGELFRDYTLRNITTEMESSYLDYAMSEAGGVTNFVRQYTLASGGPYCDCGYQKKRV